MAQIITTPVDYSTRTEIDWSQYADGNSWLLTRGVDYAVKTNTVVTAARRFGTQNGFAVDAKRFNDNERESVALRFRRATTVSGDVPDQERSE